MKQTQRQLASFGPCTSRTGSKKDHDIFWSPFPVYETPRYADNLSSDIPKPHIPGNSPEAQLIGATISVTARRLRKEFATPSEVQAQQPITPTNAVLAGRRFFNRSEDVPA